MRTPEAQCCFHFVGRGPPDAPPTSRRWIWATESRRRGGGEQPGKNVRLYLLGGEYLRVQTSRPYRFYDPPYRQVHRRVPHADLLFLASHIHVVETFDYYGVHLTVDLV